MHKIKTVVLCVVCVALWRPAAAAADQVTVAAFEPPLELGICCFGGAYQVAFSQSFVAQAAGTINRVDVPLWAASPPTGDISLSLYRAEAGTPVGGALMTTTIAAALIPRSCCFANSKPVSFQNIVVPVRRGDTLAMVLDGSSQAQWFFGHGYADGFLSIRQPNGVVWNPSPFGGSGHFRVFAEDAAGSPVPEPGTMTLLAAGLIALLRKRAKADSIVSRA